MMRELGMPSTAAAVARHYGDVLDGFVLDAEDEASAGEVRESGIDVLVTNTVMESLQDRAALARAVLGFAGRCGKP